VRPLLKVYEFFSGLKPQASKVCFIRYTKNFLKEVMYMFNSSNIRKVLNFGTDCDLSFLSGYSKGVKHF
jgi:hypothetical protein